VTINEKIWSGEAVMKYPKQWIVFVNIEYDSETHKQMGVIHLVTPSKEEAYDEARNIGRSMGKKAVMEGFNDTPQIGGLSLWSR
jgi:hypothetical protein